MARLIASQLSSLVLNAGNCITKMWLMCLRVSTQEEPRKKSREREQEYKIQLIKVFEKKEAMLYSSSFEAFYFLSIIYSGEDLQGLLGIPLLSELLPTFVS